MEMLEGVAEPQRHCFLQADAGLAATPRLAITDLSGFAAALKTELAALVRHPCDAVVAGPIVVEPTHRLLGADGSNILLAIPLSLADAMVNFSFGGALLPRAGAVLKTMSVGRSFDAIAVAAACAIGRSFESVGAWQSAAIPDNPITATEVRLDVAGASYSFGILYAAAPSRGDTQEVEWRSRLRNAVEEILFPVHARLFEKRLSLAAVQRLQLGDVVPIDTPSTIQLCVGHLRVARGTVAADLEGSHCVTISGVQTDREQSA